MVRYLLFLILGIIVYQVLKGLIRSLTATGERGSRLSPARGDDLVRDPECETYVPRADALPAVVGGVTHYFCSSECLTKFTARAGRAP